MAKFQLITNPQSVPSILLGGSAPKRRPPQRQHDAALMGVLAITEGFRAAKTEIDRLRMVAQQAAAEAKATERQEFKTKMAAFTIYYLMAAALGYAGWAGLNG